MNVFRKDCLRCGAALALLLVLLGSCKKTPPEVSVEAGPVVTRPQNAEAVFVQGHAEFERNGARQSLEQGARLEAGDTIIAGDDASAELEFASLANIRMLPGSRLVIRNFSELQGNGSEPRRNITLFLEQGALLAKVQKLTPDDGFFITTPNSVNRVRGTRFLLRYEPGAGSPQDAAQSSSAQSSAAQSSAAAPADGGGKTTLAVQEGAVAFLPSGPVLRDIQEQGEAGASTLFEELFALAPLAEAGEEALISGVGEGLVPEPADFDRLLDELRTKSESETSAETRQLIQEALKQYTTVSLGPGSEELLELMDHVRDPGTGYSVLPAALPARFIASYPQGPGQLPPREIGRPEIPPKPYPALLWEKQLEGGAPVTNIDRAGRTLFVLDARGRVYSISEAGSLLWGAGEAVALSGFDNSMALTSRTGLALLEAVSGESRGVYLFNGWAGLPRSKGILVPQGIALATPRGVTICRQENAQLIREIPVAGGIISSLILAGRELAGINGQGRIVIIDAAAGAIRLEIPANLGTEVYTPCYHDGVIYGTNKSGRVIAVELQSGNVKWEKTLESGIRVEPELDASRLYLWLADNTLVRIHTADGSDAGSPIPNVESAPLLSSGKLYFGGPDGTLVSADPASGRILKKNPIPGVSSVRPLLVGNILYAGTLDGRLIRLDASQL
ncbi:MAG: PQQ-binding-like beta-propeller repeat protein [Spirochaetaceae bacterium]|nr:PQQ-binding-like beta-propeller repeat protein [Spirochaetaceae bacterium]